ncbi:MAG: hypothetical protein Q6J78_06455, partial [Thermostichales cyanobacterium SRBZ-1_bins_19]
WHPAMRAVAAYRKTLKVRTIFNLLGPLVNPLGPTHQVLGVYEGALLPIVAEALALLGCQGAVVLHSREGMDEAGLQEPTDLALLQQGQVTMTTVLAADLGLTPAPRQALQGGDLAENVRILSAVLQGQATPAQRDAVALNSALALHLAGSRASLPQALSLAQEILSSGAAWQRLQQLVTFLSS